MKNAYEDRRRAEAYSRLEFPGTYYLAYRDLPAIFEQHVRGDRAIDFGCGTGRSTRFLKQLGFGTIGVDISAEMVHLARETDPEGEYLLAREGDFSVLPEGRADLVLSAFTFDNIPTNEKRAAIARGLAAWLSPGGRWVNLVSSPEVYRHEWASFSTKDYPENARARSGDVVRIIVTDLDDARPVEDVVCSDEDYLAIFDGAGLELAEVYRPLGAPEDPCEWVSETEIAPWVIHVLGARTR